MAEREQERAEKTAETGEAEEIPQIKREPDNRSTTEILRALIRANGWEKQLDLYSIFPQWEELVGENIAMHAKPVKIERDTLWLEVENSSWLTELQYSTYDILEGVNSRLTLGRIRDIKMALPRKGEVFIPPQKPQIEVEFIPPDEESAAEYREKADTISDELCRESLFSFWYIAQSCRRSDWQPEDCN